MGDRKYNGLVEEVIKNFNVDVRMDVEGGFTTPSSSNKKVTLDFSLILHRAQSPDLERRREGIEHRDVY